MCCIKSKNVLINIYNSPHSHTLFQKCTEMLPSEYSNFFSDYYKRVLENIKFDYNEISDDDYKDSDDEGNVKSTMNF